MYFFSHWCFLFSQDKSTPEDPSSWNSFKTMTPELSIVPGEQKDRLELHNKNWDSSSANTPNSSEGDFQTEVWRHTDTDSLKHMQAHVEIKMHTEILDSSKKYKKVQFFSFLVFFFFLQGIQTLCSLSHALCFVGPHTVFVYSCRGQIWKEHCSTLYFRKDYWKEEGKKTWAGHVCDWRRFLNELKGLKKII